MSHHIGQLRVRDFRQLHDLELQKLGGINLFVGVNNSGKTSVLEAISVHCRPLDPLEWISTVRRREVKSSREPVLDAVRWLFPQDAAEQDDPYYKGEVLIEGNGPFANLETRATYAGIVGPAHEDEGVSADAEDEENDEDQSGSSISSLPLESQELGADITLSARVPAQRWLEFEADGNGICRDTFELWENERYVRRLTPSALALPVTTVSPFSHRVRQLQVKQVSEATLKGTKFSVLDAVKLLDSDIEDLEILSRTGIRPTIYLRHKRTGFTPLSVVGDGIRRVLTIALNLISVQHGALLIDEIETAVHKDALGKVFEWMVKACLHYDVQLFATTHSLEAVDAIVGAKDVDLREVNGYRLESMEGKSTARRYTGDLLHRLRNERGLDVR